MAQSESCCNCVYSYWDRRQAMWSLSAAPTRPACANHPESLGRMQECPPGRVCPNFRAQPPTPQGAPVKMIPLGGGFYAYVDAADYEWLSRWTWHLRGGYAIRLEKQKHVYMHRQIMQPPAGMVVDHKNCNKLDNTRANLRICTRQENMRNRAKRQGTSSRFKGVSYSKRHGKYFATVYGEGESPFLGLFTDEVEAARAYDRKAVEVFGQFARPNFPEEWPPARRKRVHAQWLRTQARPKAQRPPEKPKRRARSTPKRPARKRRKATGKRKQTSKRE
jgi:hypothetical protein